MSAIICMIKFELKLWLEIKPSWLNLQIKKGHLNANDNKMPSLRKDYSSNFIIIILSGYKRISPSICIFLVVLKITWVVVFQLIINCTFSLILILVTFSSVTSSNFMIYSKKNWAKHADLIWNVILISICFMFQTFSCC